ncbi:MAG: GH3 auxin-responsive promoter family protein [Planctomycetota bacterium]
MIRAPSLRVLNRAYRASLRPAWERFRRAADDPFGAQLKALERVLQGAAGTAFAREHGLDGVRTLRDYQAAVPVRGYDEHAPWIERMLQGEGQVLTREAPTCFERSSGSTSASKYLPYTPALLREFGAATSPWLYDLLRHQALRGSSYWSISTSASSGERTPGGTRIGLADDTEYFPRPIRGLLQYMLPVPSAVSRLPDMDHCRHATLCYLLRDPTLSFVSVWAPSFLTLLLERASRTGDALLRDLEGGRAPAPGRAP